MNKDEIIALAARFTDDSPCNYITGQAALTSGCAGMRIYERPIFAFGAADDGLYDEYKTPGVIGEHFSGPAEWLPSARTVISFFLPYTEKIKVANAADRRRPAAEWLHGRYEGQIFLECLLEHLERAISDRGYRAVAPSLSEGFRTGVEGNRFTSNWSERHAAYACGLGTFGLSKGLITKKGVCGRIGSVITELDIEKDVRDYDDIYGYCSMCGACVKRCPVAAISLRGGKKHSPCSAFLDLTKKENSPRYGCGKCQTGTPCQSGIPEK